MIYEILDGATVINRIDATAEFMAANYLPAQYQPANTQPSPQQAPTKWLIDHGPLLDRFGLAIKLQFMESTHPRVVALRTDFFGRKWLDLQNQDLQGGFMYLAGVTIPGLGTIPTAITGLTPALVSAVFSTPVDPKENLALRKLYFS